MPVKGSLGEMGLWKYLGGSEGFSCPAGEGESGQCLIQQREGIPCATPPHCHPAPLPQEPCKSPPLVLAVGQ